ncbi:hypothetical protein PR048_014017 [Dryococelus australis]|uniref:Uncharacterized protein n=1 Tax=Dryococelus australis TaxID=614101 RepID=A0ABQ9HUQ7_9NEOP|nr:hypothetical protein PR048_014017 [Dryococelus australis]
MHISAFEKQVIASVRGVEKFSTYIEYKEFDLQTDNQALTKGQRDHRLLVAYYEDTEGAFEGKIMPAAEREGNEGRSEECCIIIIVSQKARGLVLKYFHSSIRGAQWAERKQRR